MKTVYQCDYCNQVFANEAEAREHETNCGHNPKNKINSKLVFRLSMIYHSLSEIIACALYEVAKDELDYLYREAQRADSTNCPFVIKQHQGEMLRVLFAAKTVADKHNGRNSSTYKDIVRENPELFNAVIDTLKRKAWNEQ